MKRISKKFGFSGKYYPQGSWTKYDDRLYDGIDNNDISKIKSAMRKNGVSCVKQDSNGSTALHLGCMRGQMTSVKIMLKTEKPDLTVMDATGRTPLHVAAQGGHIDCIKYLLRYKSPLDIQDVLSMTPLHYCVDGCFEDCVSLLLKHGAPVNIKEKDGRTALALAAQVENEKVINLLCYHGAHLNSQDNSGRTALMYASEKGLRNIVGILLLKGADPAIKDHNQKTAADYAKAGGHIALIEVLGTHTQDDCQIEEANGTNGTPGQDSVSEYDSIVAEDSLTLNSSSSFGDMETVSENSPMSPNGFEFGMIEPFELQRELQSLKTELKTETLKRTKAERELRSLRMQLEVSQASDEEAPVEFDDEDCNLILSEIEKNIPSPLNNFSQFEAEEETPLVSSLRGEVNALEIQIDRLKKELEEVKSNDGNETKIPLTVYKALKESHQKYSGETNRTIAELQSKLNSEREAVASLAKENEALKDKLNDYKDTLEKNDKKEKLRESNEKIVSLKIQLSHLEHFKEENEELRAQIELFNVEKDAEIKNLTEKLLISVDEKKALAKNYDRKVVNYREALLSAYQGTLDQKLGTILGDISKLRGCMITEL